MTFDCEFTTHIQRSLLFFLTVFSSYPHADLCADWESRERFRQSRAARREYPNQVRRAQDRDFAECSADWHRQSPDLWASAQEPREFSRPET